MKYVIVFMVVIVFALHVKAQPTLTKTFNQPLLGDINTKQLYDSTGVVPKSSGANQVWDFSSLVSNSNTEVSNFISTSAAGGPSYSGANLVESYGSTKFFMKTGTTQYEIVAIRNTNFNLNFSNNTAIQYVWPVSFGYYKNDAFSGTVFANNLNGNVTGNVITSASGSGTLILPDGTSHPNVLQVKFSLAAQASFLLGLTTVDVKIVNYFYYDMNNKFPLMGIRYTDASGAYTSKTAEILVNTSLVGINDENFETTFNIFPNPAKDKIYVKLSNPKNEYCKIEVLNTTGQVIKIFDYGNATEISENISIVNFSSGLYFVKTSLGDKCSVRKLIIE